MPATSRTSRRPRALRRVGVLASLAGLVLVLSGCSTPGETKDYNELTESNFVDACHAANDNEGLTTAEADERCACWYGAVVDEVDFDTFKQDDRNIREAVDNGTFNNPADFQREAPTLHKAITENCQTPAGPTAG